MISCFLQCHSRYHENYHNNDDDEENFVTTSPLHSDATTDDDIDGVGNTTAVPTGSSTSTDGVDAVTDTNVDVTTTTPSADTTTPVGVTPTPQSTDTTTPVGVITTPQSTDNVTVKNQQIIEKYQILVDVIPDLFAFDEINSFDSIMQLASKAARRRRNFYKKSCGRKYTILEKYLTNQLQRIKRKALKKYASNCTRDDTPDLKKDMKGADIPLDYENDDEKHMSVKRDHALVEPVCFAAGTEGSDDTTVNFCKECLHCTDLGDRIYPRHINEYRCGAENNDISCIWGDGVCMENVIHVTFLYDENNQGFDNLYKWTPYQQPISTKCSCECLKGTFMHDFFF